jgi:hypothetical protein
MLHVMYALVQGRTARDHQMPPVCYLFGTMSPERNIRLCNIIVVVLVSSVVALGQDSGWFARSDRNKAEQPHWITPLATTTPRLEQEFRYDIVWQELGGGRNIANYGNSKGLELIPFDRTEIILGVPPYLSRNFPSTPDGFGDFSWLVKYRVASANEQHGNYIVTVFLGGALPTGSNRNGAEHATFAPSLAYGKGWGEFDVQGTFGVTLPVADAATLGTPVAWNNALQYRVAKKLWPEVELNTTFFPNGPRAGMKQVFVTPGMIVGRLRLTDRVGLTFGGGVQIATTRFHTSNHNVILSIRLPF